MFSLTDELFVKVTRFYGGCDVLQLLFLFSVVHCLCLMVKTQEPDANRRPTACYRNRGLLVDQTL